MLLVGEAALRAIGVRAALLERGVGADELARHEIRADAEVLERSLRLSPHSLSAGTLTSPRLSRSIRSPAIPSSAPVP